MMKVRIIKPMGPLELYTGIGYNIHIHVIQSQNAA